MWFNRRMLRWFIGLLVLVAVAAGAAFWVAGRTAPPRITIEKPDRAVGQAGSVDVTVEVPNGRLSSLVINLEQNGSQVPLYSLDAPQSATVTQTAASVGP